MKLNRRKLRKIILKEMEEMTGGEKALRGYLQGLPHERDRISQGPSHDHNLGDYNIHGELDNTIYGDDDMDRDRFDAEVQDALDKLVHAGVLGRSSEGYYVADGDIITPSGNIDISNY